MSGTFFQGIIITFKVYFRKKKLTKVSPRRVRESWLPWKSKKYYLLGCVHAPACACVHVSTRARGRVHVALRMRHIVTSSVVPLSPPHFSTLSHKWCDFRKKKKELPHIKCVFIFSTIFVENISHSKENLDIVKNVETSSYKVPVILVEFY